MNCDNCGSDKTSLLLGGLKDYEYAVAGRWQLVRCGGCGLVRLSPFPTYEETLGYYPDNYVQHHPRKSKIVSSLFRRFVVNQGLEMKKYAGDNPRVLDIGCGCGEFMKILKEEFPSWSFTGIEPNARAAELGRSWGLDIRTGSLESVNLPEASFDLVILTHVIEHVPSPRATLGSIMRLLKPGGWLFGETENIDAIDARILKNYWGLMHIPRHLHFFTVKTLEDIMGRAGFADARCVHTYNPGGWALGFQFLIEEKIFGRITPGRTSYYPLLLLAAMPISAVTHALGMQSCAVRFIGRKP